MPGAIEKTLFSLELDTAGSLASMQQFSAAYRQMLGGLGDSPEVQSQLKQLDEWDAKLKALQGSMQETAAAGESAGAGLDAAGKGAAKADPSISSVRTAAGALAGELGRITGMSPTVINSLQSMAFVGFNPMTLAIAGAAAGLGVLSQAMAKAARDAEQLRQTLAANVSETRGLVGAIEDYYQTLDKHRGKTFLSAAEVDMQGQLMTDTLIDKESAGNVVALAKDQGLNDVEAMQFANAYRADPRRYSLDTKGVRRFLFARGSGRAFAMPTEEERQSLGGRGLSAEGQALRDKASTAGGTSSADLEAQLLEYAKICGPKHEKAVRTALGMERGGFFSLDEMTGSGGGLQESAIESEEFQNALRANSATYEWGNRWIGNRRELRPANEVHVAQQVNITSHDGRSPSLGVRPRGGLDE